MGAAMADAMLMIRNRLDRFGVLLSGLCALHCLASLLLVAGLGIGGELLLDPAIHRVGLVLAILVGTVTLSIGVLKHGDPRPMQFGGVGLGLMMGALFFGHSSAEVGLTIAGVAMLGWAHLSNLRLSH
jgi:MerC mercury resistance protein